MKAVAAVKCGSTYHIKIVVADAVDDAWDSGVFLEAGSFSVSEPGSISIEVNTAKFFATETVVVQLAFIVFKV